MRTSIDSVSRGTPQDLIDAAAVGARIAVRSYRARGLGDEAIRRKICSRFAQIFAHDDHDVYACETLMVAVQRACDDVMAESLARPGLRAAPWRE